MSLPSEEPLAVCTVQPKRWAPPWKAWCGSLMFVCSERFCRGCSSSLCFQLPESASPLQVRVQGIVGEDLTGWTLFWMTGEGVHGYFIPVCATTFVSILLYVPKVWIYLLFSTSGIVVSNMVNFSSLNVARAPCHSLSLHMLLQSYEVWRVRSCHWLWGSLKPYRLRRRQPWSVQCLKICPWPL